MSATLYKTVDESEINIHVQNNTAPECVKSMHINVFVFYRRRQYAPSSLDFVSEKPGC